MASLDGGASTALEGAYHDWTSPEVHDARKGMEESVMGATPMVLESARARIASLKPLAAELSTKSDAFTDVLRTIEHELQDAGIGIDCEYDALLKGPWQETDDDNEPAYTLHTRLAFGRYRQEWRLLSRVYRYPTVSDNEFPESCMVHEVPVVEASRDLRIAAAELITGFLEKLAGVMRQKIASLDQVLDKK